MKPTLPPYLDRLIIVALAGLSYVLFFHGLGGIGLVGPDEPRYAAIAREMLMTGDYTTPRLYGIPWFEKPPLMYWFAAIGYKIFGINEAGARFPSAFGATIGVFFVYWCGRRLWDRATGFSPLSFLGHRSAGSHSPAPLRWTCRSPCASSSRSYTFCWD